MVTVLITRAGAQNNTNTTIPKVKDKILAVDRFI